MKNKNFQNFDSQIEEFMINIIKFSNLGKFYELDQDKVKFFSDYIFKGEK